MSNPYAMPQGGMGGSAPSGPPGQNLLGICLAALAAVIGTPYVFEFVGPFVEWLIYKAYGWQDLADVMYFASFALTGASIYAVCRILIWYALAAIITFGAVRWGSALAPLPGI